MQRQQSSSQVHCSQNIPELPFESHSSCVDISVDKHGVQTARCMHAHWYFIPLSLTPPSFKPLDPSLPDFQVPCKWGFTEKNRLIVIEFIDWKASIKRPQGALKCDLGWVGDAQAESRALQLHYRPPFAPKRAVDEATAQLVDMVRGARACDGVKL